MSIRLLLKTCREKPMLTNLADDLGQRHILAGWVSTLA